MMNVRIIVKQTIQPPIDTPASLRWHTIDLEANELADLLNGVGIPAGSYSTFEVIGAELLPKAGEQTNAEGK